MIVCTSLKLPRFVLCSKTSFKDRKKSHYTENRLDNQPVHSSLVVSLVYWWYWKYHKAISKCLRLGVNATNVYFYPWTDHKRHMVTNNGLESSSSPLDRKWIGARFGIGLENDSNPGVIGIWLLMWYRHYSFLQDIISHQWCMTHMWTTTKSGTSMGFWLTVRYRDGKRTWG